MFRVVVKDGQVRNEIVENGEVIADWVPQAIGLAISDEVLKMQDCLTKTKKELAEANDLIEHQRDKLSKSDARIAENKYLKVLLRDAVSRLRGNREWTDFIEAASHAIGG